MEKSSLAKFIDHITTSDPFDSETFIYCRNMQGNNEDGEYQLRASYVHGAAYLEGLVGSNGIKIKVFYNHLQGAQLWVSHIPDPVVTTWSQYRINEMLDKIIHLAKQ